MRFRLVALILSVCVAIAGLGVGGAGAQDAAAVARDHLARNAGTAGLTAGEVEAMVVSDIVPGPPGVEIVYLQQRHAGLDVHNALATVAVKGQEVIHVADSLVAGVPASASGQDARLSDVEAAQAAAEALGLEVTEVFTPAGDAEGLAAQRELSDGGISREPIPVELVWQAADDGSVALAWRLLIFEVGEENYWDIRIDAQTGKELGRVNWIVNHTAEHDEEGAAEELVDGSSYNVIADPAESPNHTIPIGSQRVVPQPAWDEASPFGWHDTNGVAGAEFTTTQGNNVHAYTDIDGNGTPDLGSSPDGGAGLDFLSVVDLTQPPSAYRPAAVTNLFYWNNLIHDVFYRYGFDEASGNFQVNNYGNGGLGNDDVRAEAQDGGGTNNANFFTPADGQRPRMQMFNWTAPDPRPRR